MEIYGFIRELSSLISDLNGLTNILDHYPGLYIYGIPLAEEYEIKFYRYIIYNEPTDIIVDSEVVKRNFSKLLTNSFKSNIPLCNMNYTEGYLLDRIKSYLPEDVQAVYLWIILCGILKLKEYRSFFVSWYPNKLYVHSMNQVMISPEDKSLFRNYFGKEYHNMIRFFLICIGDLIHDCPTKESDGMLGTILEKIENKVKSCDNLKDIVDFLNKSYIQLLIIMSTELI